MGIVCLLSFVKFFVLLLAFKLENVFTMLNTLCDIGKKTTLQIKFDLITFETSSRKDSLYVYSFLMHIVGVSSIPALHACTLDPYYFNAYSCQYVFSSITPWSHQFYRFMYLDRVHSQVVLPGHDQIWSAIIISTAVSIHLWTTFWCQDLSNEILKIKFYFCHYLDIFSVLMNCPTKFECVYSYSYIVIL